MCLRERLPREKAGEHHHTVKQLLKGSVAFTSALLLGNGETKGLVRTLGAASLEAGKNALQAFWKQKPSPANGKDDRTTALSDEDFDSVVGASGWRDGPEGYGYYGGGYRLDDNKD